MKGVLDRIEDGVAIILVEERDEQFTVPAHDLPAGSNEGTWFTLRAHGDEYSIVAIDEQRTASQKERINKLQQKLRKKRRTSKFKRKSD